MRSVGEAHTKLKSSFELFPGEQPDARSHQPPTDKQLGLDIQVAGENSDLCFEIQSLNEYRGESLAELSDAVERLPLMVNSDEGNGFVAFMEQGTSYLHERMQR